MKQRYHKGFALHVPHFFRNQSIKRLRRISPELAQIFVKAVEVALGRYMGAEKRVLVKQWFQDRGIIIAEEVEIIISNAWTEINYKMIGLGLKDAVAIDPSAAVKSDAFPGTDTFVQLK